MNGFTRVMILAVLALRAPLVIGEAIPDAHDPLAVTEPPVSANTAPVDPSGPPLTLEQCVAEALAKNFSVRLQTYVVNGAAEGVIVAQSAFDPVLGVTWQKFYQKGALDDPSLQAKPVTNSQSTLVTVTQPVETGATVTANYQLARNATNQSQFINSGLPVQFNPEFDGQTGISLTQPLLQGFGLDYSRATIHIAQMTATIARLDYKTTVMTAILNVESAYFNLILTRKQYAVAQDSLKLAKELLDDNVEKSRAGILMTLDVVQARAGVANARSRLIGYKQAMDNAEDILLQGMGERRFRSPVGQVDFPPLADTNVSFDISYKLSRDNTPELIAQQLDIDRLKETALRAKRDSLPQLNAIAGANYLSAASSYSLANSTLWKGPGYDWNAGLAFTFPLGMRGNRALYRQALENARRQEVSRDQYDQNLVVQVRGAVRAVRADVEAVNAAAQSVLLSQKQYELQRAKFDSGLATSYDVVLAQNDLETARIIEIQSQVSLRVALASLHYYEGTSLAQYHINID